MTFQSTSGWRCQVCYHEGMLYDKRKDGEALSEADRCKGCGETICDRHPRPPQGAAHPEGWEFHTYEQLIEVTQVPEAATNA